MSSEKLTPTDIRKNEIINLVVRQTNYSEDEATQQLEKHNYNYLNVIKEYMNVPSKTVADRNVPQSVNQQIYTEIRNFLDTGVEKYERNKRITERINQIRQAQQQSQQQAQQLPTLDETTEENETNE